MARSEVVGVAVALGLAGAVWWLRAADEAPPPASEVAGRSVRATGGSGVSQQEEIVIDPRLGARASIAGTVRDPRGKPVVGAQVCASALSDRLTQEELRRPLCATSERDGHYRIAELFGVRHEVNAGAPGFKPTTYAHGEGARRREWLDLRPGMEALAIDIVLEDGGVEVHGVVKDLSGGPIEGAQVQGFRQFFVHTGAEGEFSMWVAPGEVMLFGLADGYAVGRDEGPAPGHAYEIFLTPEAVLVGKVVRAGSGEPLAGVRVESGGRGVGSATWTDAQGQFRIDRLPPGIYKPRAEADDVYGLVDEQVMLGLGETSEPLVITAHPAFFVEGRVVVEGGGGCDNGMVVLRDGASARGGRAQIEPDGLARLRAIRPGEYQVEVRCEGHVSADMYEKVKIAERSVSGLEWKVSRGQAIRGVVVDAKGQPVAKIGVGATPRPDPAQPRAQQTTGWGAQSDAQGRFEVRGLLAGRYVVEAEAWGRPRADRQEPLEVTLPKGQDLEGLRIELPATGEVRGTVRDAQGRPVRGASVMLAGGIHFSRAPVADDGSFRFEHVAPGTYRAEVRRGNELMRAPDTSDNDVQGETFAVRVDATTTVELVVASASGTITGVVRDEDGAAVADAFVESARESDNAAASAGQSSRQTRFRTGQRPNLTDAEGRFSLTGLSEGKHTLRASRRGGGEAIVEHVALGSEVTLTIAAAGRIAGTVALRGGGAPEEFSVNVSDETSGYSRSDQFYRTGGAWSFAEVPPGKFKVQVNTGAGNAETQVTVTAGQELAGVRIELAPKVTVRGTVVDLEDRPVPGLSVVVMGNGAPPSVQDGDANVTDGSGRFEFRNAPTGAVSLWVMPPSDLSEFTRTTVPAVLSAEASTVELAPIRVSRRRVHSGERPGDRGFTLREPEPGADPLRRQWVVAHVRAGGPAARAGLVAGDVIVSVDGHDVTGANSYLYPALMATPADTTLTLGLARGASVQLTVAAPM